MTAETDAMRLVPDFQEYRRSQIANLRPYIEGETLSDRVSISAADKEAGSPKAGDMIARNPANHDDQWLVAADYFAANFEPAAPAVQPAAGREEIARIVAAHLPTADCPDTVCLPITMTAGDLRRVYAALTHPPAQGSESGGEGWSLLKARVDTLVNILAPDQGEMLTEDGRRVFAIASAIQSDLTALSQPGPASEGDGE